MGRKITTRLAMSGRRVVIKKTAARYRRTPTIADVTPTLVDKSLRCRKNKLRCTHSSPTGIAMQHIGRKEAKSFTVQRRSNKQNGSGPMLCWCAALSVRHEAAQGCSESARMNKNFVSGLIFPIPSERSSRWTIYETNSLGGKS